MKKTQSSRMPWTNEQIQALVPILDDEMREIESECEGIRPLPAMLLDEARDLVLRFIHQAESRQLTNFEATIMGQLLSVFEQAVRADMLGKKGRYFVISEDDVTKMMEEKGIK